MNPIIRNILAVIAGWIIGSIVNMGLVQAGHAVYPIPGVEPDDIDGLVEVMSTLDFRYFIFPFFAHALGTLTGAFVAAAIATRYKMRFALVIGLVFFFGGLYVNALIPGPIWFTIADLLLAYIPMAWIGGRMVKKRVAGK
ncbi:MAG: hypothetical protein WBA74_07175 [Cyclobacteriaceae bacterium]